MSKLKSVLITTEHKGVFYAEVEPDADLSPKTLKNLKNCRMAIYWNTTKGVFELCEEGPNKGSRVSSKTDIEVLHYVTAVMTISEKAKEKWQAR